jgi:hypothetical protein
LGLDKNGNPVFKGTNKKTIGFQFKGASASDAVVTFDDELESDIGLRFVSGQRCEVPKAIVTTCILELKPSKNSNGTHPAIVKTMSANTGSGKNQPGEITIEPETQLPNNPCRGIQIAALLVLSFLLIQGLQRFFFAWLITRYAPVSATAKRVRLDVSIDSSGSLSIHNKTNISDSDESFNFDNNVSTLSFDAFGFSFICSPTETFFHSTSSPRGQVVHTYRHVIGSAGLVTSKKDKFTKGLVDLTLRGQWVLGIDASQAESLVSGSLTVPAELVVFLEPYEKKSREEQLVDLEFTIASSNLNRSVTSLIENLLSKVEEESEETHDIWTDALDDILKGKTDG